MAAWKREVRRGAGMGFWFWAEVGVGVGEIGMVKIGWGNT